MHARTLTELFKLVPEGGNDEGIDGDAPDESELPEPPENPSGLKLDEWEEVEDPDTGEVYYWNKITGLTQWERPRADSNPPPLPPKPKLLPGWEAIKDEDSGDVYYWHEKTQTR